MDGWNGICICSSSSSGSESNRGRNRYIKLERRDGARRQDRKKFVCLFEAEPKENQLFYVRVTWNSLNLVFASISRTMMKRTTTRLDLLWLTLWTVIFSHVAVGQGEFVLLRRSLHDASEMTFAD